MSLLVAQGVSLSRSGIKILSGIDLSVARGELVVLLGPSGSGKSTALKVLAGLMRPDQGEVYLEGRPLSDVSQAELARQVGCVPQDDIIHTGLRLRPALEYAAQLRLPAGTPPEAVSAAVTRVLSDLELSERGSVRIRKLSGGQRKRASMGIELLCAPAALLLDEPTSGLDPDLEAITMRLLRRLADEGRGVLTTTHAMASLGLANRVVVLVQGHLAYAGSPAGALAHFGVSDHELIFKALREAQPREWAQRFRSRA